ncbi:TIGR02647 family protein [Marinobacter sp. M1N3S26]|uniref:TIGR02647 family protein n=1 Tax=unclassified Marinobacter TaxID=83889 RepID=UPI00387A9BE1
MPFNNDHLSELNLLAMFDGASSREGIKVHQHSAPLELVDAAERLYRKGLITQRDGGYLTPLGNETAEHVQKVLAILSSSPDEAMPAANGG